MTNEIIADQIRQALRALREQPSTPVVLFKHDVGEYGVQVIFAPEEKVRNADDTGWDVVAALVIAPVRNPKGPTPDGRESWGLPETVIPLLSYSEGESSATSVERMVERAAKQAANILTHGWTMKGLTG